MSGAASIPANLSRIVLTGFMGAGKTTVGALLAERLGWEFADSDRVVEALAAMTVGEIFERRGEAAFREMEAAAIREIAAGRQRVIAIGGGALELGSTREFLASLPDAVAIFLHAPLETLVARCAEHENGPVRPVLADRAQLAERWRLRLPWYRQAQLTVETSGRSPEAVAEAILLELDAGRARHAAAMPVGRARDKSGVSA